MFRDLILWGDVNEIAVNPPTIVVEAFDKDIGVSYSINLSVRPSFRQSISQSVGWSASRSVGQSVS